MEEALYLAEQDNRIYVRSTGHVTANSCADLKARVFDRLESQPAIESVYVDLSDCEYMDSTFMGLLVGFNKRFLRFSERPITIIKANETCMKLLRTIGMSRLVEMSDEMPGFPDHMERIGTGRPVDAGFILGAHDDLIELSEENEKRFSALRSVLSQQLDKQEADTDET